MWNDFYRVRDACQQSERQLGLRVTALADRTAARRATRAEAEQSARGGWTEPPRVRLRREVCAAAGGAATEQEFFTQLQQAGVMMRWRFSTVSPDQVTGYAVGLPRHMAAGGAVICQTPREEDSSPKVSCCSPTSLVLIQDPVLASC